jgi:hypothetical protein
MGLRHKNYTHGVELPGRREGSQRRRETQRRRDPPPSRNSRQHSGNIVRLILRILIIAFVLLFSICFIYDPKNSLIFFGTIAVIVGMVAFAANEPP